MNKLMISAALAAALSSTALANDSAVYLRADVGASMLPKAKIHNGVAANKTKVKSSTSFVGSVGVGSYVMENVRAELNLANIFSPERKGTFTDEDGDKYNDKQKLKATSLMVSALVDAVDLGVGKMFVGAGIGAAQVSEKFSSTFEGVTTNVKVKKANNFAWTLGTGVAFDVAEGVKLDVAYNYADFGKTKSKKVDGDLFGKSKVTSHNVTAGVRFEL